MSYFVHRSHRDAAQVQRVNSLQLHAFLEVASFHVDKSRLQMTVVGEKCVFWELCCLSKAPLTWGQQ